MSNTYKHKDYFKCNRAFKKFKCSCHHRGNIYCICGKPTCDWWENHRFQCKKTPRDSKTAKYIIQTLGHHRRRASERVVCGDVKNISNNYSLGGWLLYFILDQLEYDDDYYHTFENDIDDVYDIGLKLDKKWSNVWDYY